MFNLCYHKFILIEIILKRIAIVLVFHFINSFEMFANNLIYTNKWRQIIISIFFKSNQ